MQNDAEKKKNGKRGRRPNHGNFVNEKTERDYAIAVERFFSGYPDKDSVFRVASKDEERAAIERFKDDRPSLENFLMTHNIFLAINLASHYSRMYSDHSELISNAMFGLSEAAKKFDPSLGNRFNTYASHWILKRIKYPFYNDVYNRRIAANTSVYLDSADFSKDDADGSPCYSAFSASIEPTCRHSAAATSTPCDEIDRRSERLDKGALIDMITYSVNASSLSTTDKRIYNEMFIDGKHAKDVSDSIGVPMMSVIKGKNRVTEYISRKFSKLRDSVR